jgi:hypothetical protein
MGLFYSPRQMGILLSLDKNLKRDEVAEEEQDQSE